jgi:hypothetical protein
LSVAVDDLPLRLEASIPRLEAAGYETQPVRAGPNAIPALLVRAEPPVVLATPEGNGGFPGPNLLPVRDPDGGTVDVTYSVGCSRAVAAGASRETDSGGSNASRSISQVLHASGLCSRRR